MEETDHLLPNQYEQYSGPIAHRPPSAIVIENHVTTKWKIRSSCAIILIVETCERIAFYSLIGNFVLFLKDTPFVWDNVNASLVSFIFLGIAFVTSLLGGLIADAAWGRFNTLVFAFFIYGLGYSLLTTLSFGKFSCTHERNISNKTTPPSDHQSDISNENCVLAVFLIVCTIAFGGGVFRANIAPFGADQLRDTNPVKIRSFFNCFYMCLNIGAFIGLGVVSYIQQQYGFEYGYIGAMGSLAFGFVIFLCGRCIYKVTPPNGSVIINVCRIIKDAIRSKKEHAKRTSMTTYDCHMDSSVALHYQPTFLDWAKIRHGGHFHDSLVDDIKSLGKVIVFFFFFVPYWIVYFQMETTFLLQGLHMKLDPRDAGNFTPEPNVYNCTHIATMKSPTLSVSWLSLFNVVVIVIFIPLMEKVILPWLDKNRRPISLQQRIIIGMVFATLAMVAAGLVEFQRLHTIFYERKFSCECKMVKQILNDNNSYYAADMTIFYQIPQYVLLALSEVFTIVAGLEFAYSMAPKSMKGIIMGLFQFFTGIGSFLGTPIIEIFEKEFSLKDINKYKCQGGEIVSTSHLDYYFFIMAAVQAFFVIVFMIVAHCLNFNNTILTVYESPDPFFSQHTEHKKPRLRKSR